MSTQQGTIRMEEVIDVLTHGCENYSDEQLHRSKNPSQVERKRIMPVLGDFTAVLPNKPGMHIIGPGNKGTHYFVSFSLNGKVLGSGRKDNSKGQFSLPSAPGSRGCHSQRSRVRLHEECSRELRPMPPPIPRMTILLY